MRALRTILATAALVAAILPATALAAAPAQTQISGVITKAGTPVIGASVTTSCNGNLQTVGSGFDGSYQVTYTAGQCGIGDTVNVTASQGSASGASSGTVTGVTTQLNVAVVNVSIPEFGILAGFAATLTAAGLFAINRRRELRQRD